MIVIGYIIPTHAMDISFDVYWEDDGYKDEYRPKTVDYHLVEKDTNNIIETVKLSDANAVDGDTNHWKGTFSIPNIQNSDNYKIVQEEIDSNYLHYETPGNNGFKLTYDEKANYRNSEGQTMYYKIADNTWRVRYRYVDYYDETNPKCTDIDHFLEARIPDEQAQNNESVSLHGYTTYNRKVLDESNYCQKYSLSTNATYTDEEVINDVYNSNRYSQTYNGKVEEYAWNSYPETEHPWRIGDIHVWHYKYAPFGPTEEFYLTVTVDSAYASYGIKYKDISLIEETADQTIITNKMNLKDYEFEKKWNGKNIYKNMTFELFDEKDNLIKSVTLTEDNKINDETWKGAFKNVPAYDENGKELNYTVKEKSEGFVVHYDADWFNSLEVTFQSPMKSREDPVFYWLHILYPDGNGNYTSKRRSSKAIGEPVFSYETPNIYNYIDGIKQVYPSKKNCFFI